MPLGRRFFSGEAQQAIVPRDPRACVCFVVLCLWGVYFWKAGGGVFFQLAVSHEGFSFFCLFGALERVHAFYKNGLVKLTSSFSDRRGKGS